MGLTIDNITGPVWLNDKPVTAASAVGESDLLATGAGGSVSVYSDGVLAGTVWGADSQVKPVVPPAQGVDRTYYRYSYRWQLKATGGSVGIRA